MEGRTNGNGAGGYQNVMFKCKELIAYTKGPSQALRPVLALRDANSVSRRVWHLMPSALPSRSDCS